MGSYTKQQKEHPRHSLYGRHHGFCSQTSVSLSRPLYQDRNGGERSDTEHTMECKTLRRTLCLRMAVVLLSCMNLHFIWFVFGLTLKGQKYFGLSKIRIIFSPTKLYLKHSTGSISLSAGSWELICMDEQRGQNEARSFPKSKMAAGSPWKVSWFPLLSFAT